MVSLKNLFRLNLLFGAVITVFIISTTTSVGIISTQTAYADSATAYAELDDLLTRAGYDNAAKIAYLNRLVVNAWELTTAAQQMLTTIDPGAGQGAQTDSSGWQGGPGGWSTSQPQTSGSTSQSQSTDTSSQSSVASQGQSSQTQSTRKLYKPVVSTYSGYGLPNQPGQYITDGRKCWTWRVQTDRCSNNICPFNMFTNEIVEEVWQEWWMNCDGTLIQYDSEYALWNTDIKRITVNPIKFLMGVKPPLQDIWTNNDNHVQNIILSGSTLPGLNGVNPTGICYSQEVMILWNGANNQDISRELNRKVLTTGREWKYCILSGNTAAYYSPIFNGTADSMLLEVGGKAYTVKNDGAIVPPCVVWPCDRTERMTITITSQGTNVVPATSATSASTTWASDSQVYTSRTLNSQSVKCRRLDENDINNGLNARDRQQYLTIKNNFDQNIEMCFHANDLSRYHSYYLPGAEGQNWPFWDDEYNKLVIKTIQTYFTTKTAKANSWLTGKGHMCWSFDLIDGAEIRTLLKNAQSISRSSDSAIKWSNPTWWYCHDQNAPEWIPKVVLYSPEINGTCWLYGTVDGLLASPCLKWR